MGKVKFFPPLGIAEAFRGYYIDNGLNSATPDDLRRFVDEQYPQGSPEDRPSEIYLQQLAQTPTDP